MQAGTVSRLRFCWRSWGFKIYIRRNIVRFWKSYICSNKWDVQETKVSIPQFHRIGNSFVGCWIANGWTTCSWFMGCGDRGVTFIEQYQNTDQPTQQQETVCGITNPNPNKRWDRDVDQLSHVDYVTTSANSSQGESQLCSFEDNEAVIKMIIKGRSPTTRHVSRTNRDALDWLFDRVNLKPKIRIKYVDTKNQLADMLTKGNFTHKLRGTSEFIRYHAERDIGPSSWDSQCDNDWLDSSLMGEIYTYAWSSDHVDESKSTRQLRFRLMLGENVRSFRSESKIGKSSGIISTVQFLQRIIWNWWRIDSVRVEYFPRTHSLEVLQKILKDLQEQNIEPETYTDRSIFMSMFNDIAWTKRRNSEQWFSNSEHVKNYAKRCSQGHCAFLGPGSELKWYGTQSYPPEGQGESTANQMVKRSQESDHPVFKSISALARGILKRKGNRDTLHFTADASITEVLYRTIHSANQVSIYGAVCEEFNQKPIERERERADLENFVAKENEQLLKNVKPQEAQTPRSDDPASGNRLRECLQNFETLKKKHPITEASEDTSFWKRVSIGMCTRPLQI